MYFGSIVSVFLPLLMSFHAPIQFLLCVANNPKSHLFCYMWVSHVLLKFLLVCLYLPSAFVYSTVIFVGSDSLNGGTESPWASHFSCHLLWSLCHNGLQYHRTGIYDVGNVRFIIHLSLWSPVRHRFNIDHAIPVIDGESVPLVWCSVIYQGRHTLSLSVALQSSPVLWSRNMSGGFSTEVALCSHCADWVRCDLASCIFP